MTDFVSRMRISVQAFKRGKLLQFVAFLLMIIGLALAVPPSDSLAQQAHNRDGGIGGTGIVFGPVDRLGSIVVNGMRIETANARLSSFPNRLGGGAVETGDTVFASIRSSASGPSANRVVRFYPISGPVTSAGRGAIEVMGTRVDIPAGTPVVDFTGSAVRLRAGDTVRVSGLWRGQRIVASRVVKAPNVPVTLSGQFRPVGTGNGVGSTRVEMRQDFALGAFVTIRGRFDGSTLAAERVSQTLPLRLDRQTGLLSAQGFLARDFAGSGYHLSGFGLPMNQASPVGRQTGIRSVFFGVVSGGYLIEDRVSLPDSAAARRQELDSLRPTEVPGNWRAFYQR
ncbi:hypothetical protein E1178_08345 [Roseibium hamelinense]|nr:DUF5666 domain-containing protein [Roseibium hamelinense]MTI43618.1 hypothetical protein [Roseibium hamelinense]